MLHIKCNLFITLLFLFVSLVFSLTHCAYMVYNLSSLIRYQYYVTFYLPHYVYVALIMPDVLFACQLTSTIQSFVVRLGSLSLKGVCGLLSY